MSWTRNISAPTIARLAAIIVTITGAFAFSASSALAVPPGPAGDGFYDATPQQLKGRHGKLIFARPASDATQIEGATVKTVLYKSVDARGRAVEVSGLVAVPNGPTPRGGFPLISWAHGTTGLADPCAPSRFTEEDITEGYISYQNASIKYWLDNGYAVAMTDYQGLGTPGLHQYLVGVSEGRAVLDIVPAARALFPHKLGKRYAIAGHSQGGHAALWATRLAKSWIPRNKLVGTVAFAPASSVSAQAHLINAYSSPNGISGLAIQIIKGSATQLFAGTDITSILNSRLLDAADAGLAIDGRSLWDAVDYVCSGEIGLRAAAPEPDGIAAADLLGSYDNDSNGDGIFDDPTAAALDRVFVANDPLFSNVKTPVWVPHGANDTTVYPFFTNDQPKSVNSFADGLVYKLTRPARRNRSVIYTSFPGLDHTSIITDSSVESQFIAKLNAWF